MARSLFWYITEMKHGHIIKKTCVQRVAKKIKTENSEMKQKKYGREKLQ